MWPGDVFLLRIKGSRPFIWQWGPQNTRVLFPVPLPFNDYYGVVQEWEKNHCDNQYTLRLDFLQRLQLPSSDHAHAAVNFDRFKAALNPQNHPSLTREIQQFHQIDNIYSLSESSQVLFHFGFFRPRDSEANNIPVSRPSPVLRVQVEELLDNLSQYPAKQFSNECLRQIQDLQHSRGQRLATRNALKRKNLWLILLSPI